MIAQAMAQVAIRFSEREGATSDSMMTVGQAIRREVAAIGDGIERAIARAGELENRGSPTNVAALERAYTDNEVRIRVLLQDIADQRDNLVGQAEQVRSALFARADRPAPRHRAVSDAIAASSMKSPRASPARWRNARHITGCALHTPATTSSGAWPVAATCSLRPSRGSERRARRAPCRASERPPTSLNFKTGHVHDEFVDSPTASTRC